MIRKLMIAMLMLIGLLPAARAQDGLNLPTELYILLNEGIVERYGLGISGVTRVTPDDEFVLDFRVAPDGNWIAYRSMSGIMIANMFQPDSMRLLEAERAGLPQIRGRGETIAWSPGSDALAYTTEYGGRVHFFAEGVFTDLTTPDLQHLLWSEDGAYLAAEASGGVWWFFRREGTAMNLTAALPGVNGGTWLNRSVFLFAAPEGGLTLMNLADANRQNMLLSPERVYYLPTVLLDGSIRAFAGELNRARLVEISSGDGGVTLQESGTGDVDLAGLRWAPGGLLLTAFQSGVLALIDPASGLGFTLPIGSTAAYGWGSTYPPAAAGLVLPDDALFLAPDTSDVLQVWRLPADGSLPTTITSSPQPISEFALSLDQERIAYVSSSTLFSYVPGSAEAPLEVAILGNAEHVHPAWSPDHSMIYFRDEQPQGSGIWRAVVGEAAELFLQDGDGMRYTDALPAPGVGAMLVTRAEELLLVDTTTGEITSTGMRGSARWLQGTAFTVVGQPLNSAESDQGLYRLDVNDLTPALLLPMLGELELLDYQMLPDGSIRALARNQSPGEIRIIDLQADGSGADLVGSAGYMVNPALAADGNAIIGQTIPGGALLVFDVASGARFLLDALPEIVEFRWQQRSR